MASLPNAFEFQTRKPDRLKCLENGRFPDSADKIIGWTPSRSALFSDPSRYRRTGIPSQSGLETSNRFSPLSVPHGRTRRGVWSTPCTPGGPWIGPRTTGGGSSPSTVTNPISAPLSAGTPSAPATHGPGTSPPASTATAPTHSPTGCSFPTARPPRTGAQPTKSKEITMATEALAVPYL